MQLAKPSITNIEPKNKMIGCEWQSSCNWPSLHATHCCKYAGEYYQRIQMNQMMFICIMTMPEMQACAPCSTFLIFKLNSHVHIDSYGMIYDHNAWVLHVCMCTTWPRGIPVPVPCIWCLAVDWTSAHISILHAYADYEHTMANAAQL